MSKPKFTPGQWTYNPANGEIRSGEVMIGRFHCGRDDHGNNARPLKADGVLMALAPELYEALRLLAADVQDYEPWRRPCHALDNALAILAKAKP